MDKTGILKAKTISGEPLLLHLDKGLKLIEEHVR
jgi:hypothetical protein